MTLLVTVVVCFSACAPIFFVPISLSTYQDCTAMAGGAAALPHMEKTSRRRFPIVIPAAGFRIGIRQPNSFIKFLPAMALKSPDSYIFTSIETAKSKGLILFSNIIEKINSQGGCN